MQFPAGTLLATEARELEMRTAFELRLRETAELDSLAAHKHDMCEQHARQLREARELRQARELEILKSRELRGARDTSAQDDGHLMQPERLQRARNADSEHSLASASLYGLGHFPRSPPRSQILRPRYRHLRMRRR